MGLWVQPHTAAAAAYTFTAHLTSSQVVSSPPSTSTATGDATVVLQGTPGNLPYTLTTDFTWQGLSGPADRAHVHDAAPGQPTDFAFEHEVLYVVWGDPGPVVDCFVGLQSCVPTSGSTHNVLTVDSNNVSSYVDFSTLLGLFEAGDMYIDIHTELHPSGEIRGQFLAAVVPVPEPAGLGMLGLAGAVAASIRWSRRAA